MKDFQDLVLRMAMLQEVAREGSIKLITGRDLSDSFGRYLMNSDPASRVLYGFKSRTPSKNILRKSMSVEPIESRI